MANRFLSSTNSQKLCTKGIRSLTTETTALLNLRKYSNQGWRGKNTYIEQVLYGAANNSDAAGTVWPDRLGCLGAKDKRFNLPGNIGLIPDAEQLAKNYQTDSEGKAAHAEQLKADKKIVEDEIKFWKNLVDSPTNYQTQVNTLKHHERIEKIRELETAAAEYAIDKEHFGNMEYVPHSCPDLLRKELRSMFTNIDLSSGPLTVITFSHKTKNDMSSWSPDVEDERERLVEYFVEASKKLCLELRNRAQWADFIDPNSGRPFYGGYTPLTFFETDDRYRHLGFRINDLGCCKVISHQKWGTHTFVGSIFTTAPHDCEYLEGILKNYNSSSTSDSSGTR